MNKEERSLYFLIQEVEGYITNNSDIVWTSYNSAEQLRDELEICRSQLGKGNLDYLKKLEFLFLPTGDLQEHSIANGWSEEYLKLSTEFDKLSTSIKKLDKYPKLFKWLSRVYNDILELFFPTLCVACQCRIQDSERFLCLDCLSTLPKTNYHNQTDNRLEVFLAGKFPFERAMAFAYFYKTGSLQKVIHEFKYKNNPELAIFMGELYGNDLLQTDFIKKIDFLVPVPLHPKKQSQRGYNQAEEICKGISLTTGIPICTTAIKRIINNPSQTKKSKTERWENVEGIFATTNNPSLERKNILLVDDVITTGSTLEAVINSFPKGEAPNIFIAAIGIAM